MKYIIGCGIEDNGKGISRKIFEQITAFNNAGLKCSLYEINKDINKNIEYKIKKRLPFINLYKNLQFKDLIDEDYIYIRRCIAWDGYIIDFFERLKRLNPKVKIVYEIPTYPYDYELVKSCKNWPLLLKDKWNRWQIKRFVDRIATLTEDKMIFGVPTLKISNGINVNSIRPRKVQIMKDIHAIAVANFEWWHGYDRFIEGMKKYYAYNPTKKLIFHMVGRGKELDRYKKMIKEYKLQEYIIIHDYQTGENLDKIYDKCSLGIGGLGGYRKGIHLSQELKSREYLAKGLPFVVSTKIMDISDEEKDNIYLKVPNDNTSIDIAEIIDFYDRIYSEDVYHVNERLRQFAMDNFSMESALKEVIGFFKG